MEITFTSFSLPWVGGVVMMGWCGVWWWWWGGRYLPCWISTLPEVPVAPRAVNELDVGRPLNVDLLSFSRAANIFQRNSQDLLPTHSPHSPLEMNSITLYLGRAGESLINSMILLNAISLDGWMWTIVTMMMVSTLRAYPMSQHGARYLISRFPSTQCNASTKFDTIWYFRICGPLQIEVWTFYETSQMVDGMWKNAHWRSDYCCNSWRIIIWRRIFKFNRTFNSIN